MMRFLKKTKKNNTQNKRNTASVKSKSTNALKNMWHFTFICCVKRYIYCIQRQRDVESNRKTFSLKWLANIDTTGFSVWEFFSGLEWVSKYFYMQHSGSGHVILTASSRKLNNLSGLNQTLTVFRQPVRLMINMGTLMTWHVPRQSSWICVKYLIINRSLNVV